MITPQIMKVINNISGLKYKRIYSTPYESLSKSQMTFRPTKYRNPQNSLNKVKSLNYVLDAINLKSGMTISFHHSLRNGDAVMYYILKAIADKGIKDLTLAVSSLSLIQDCLLPFFETEVITAVDTSGCRGNLGAFIQKKGLKKPAIFRTHGGRARAIETGELHIDATFIAAPICDHYGNINGVQGKSPCGSLGYAMPDAHYADHVIAVTDTLSNTVLDYISIPQTLVDYIVEIPSIGDSKGITTGSIRISKKPAELIISKLAADVIKATPYFHNAMNFQFGSGGMAIATASFIKEAMLQRGIKANAGVGGVSSFHVQMLNEGLIDTFFDPQDFDLTAIQSLYNNPRHHEISVSDYANPLSANPYVNILDFAVLSATEIDLNFNVNVLTDSYGRLMGAPGGHPDAAAGANLTIITMPLLRGRLPMLLNNVTTCVTPGETVDILVTEYGLAINPLRIDLIDILKDSSLPIYSIEELKAKADKIAGPITPLEYSDEICGLVEYRDGSIIDVIHKL